MSTWNVSGELTREQLARDLLMSLARNPSHKLGAYQPAELAKQAVTLADHLIRELRSRA